MQLENLERGAAERLPLRSKMASREKKGDIFLKFHMYSNAWFSNTYMESFELTVA